MLEGLYKTGDQFAPSYRLQGMVDELEYEDIELLTWMLRGYYKAYGDGDPDWCRNVVLVEEPMEVELPDVGYGPLTLRFVVDLVVELWGNLWIVDHKTSGRLPRRNDDAMADQWTLYVWGLRQHGYEIFGSIHNFARTEKLKSRPMALEERFFRTPIDRTAHEVQQVVAEATVQAWQAKLGLPGNPRSPGEHCWRRCSFEEACIAGRKWGDGMEHSVLLLKHRQTERRINEYGKERQDG
jgi:hypothetical protein